MRYSELEENRKSWYNTMNNLPQGAIKLINGEITFSNKAAASLFGLKA